MEGQRCGLVLVGVEIRGQFGQEAIEFVVSLAVAKFENLRMSCLVSVSRAGDVDLVDFFSET